jgi:hypothetical protein
MSSATNDSGILITILIGLIILIIVAAFITYGVKRGKENYRARNEPMIVKLREHFTRFWTTPRQWPKELAYLANRNIMAETTLQAGDKSYTINKKDVFICLKDEYGEYYPFNMLVYVLAHEYAHVISKSIGHTDEFHGKFDACLDIMIKEGFYDPSQEIIIDYCNH